MDERTVSPPNRLAGQASPYLRAHADNPVDWYPWGAEALARARREGKPILLSIGYHACHWCHVMARESFEDAATAAVMNAHYVNIKVDREERPDLDRIYQRAQQLLTGRGGGWPLTMFLRHEDQRPFFGGTYFPPRAAFGLPAFGDLLRQVADYYQQHGAELERSAAAVVAALAERPTAPGAPAELSDAPLQMARARLEQRFDRVHGGFGAAPKFPHPAWLGCLLRAWQASASAAVPDLQALYMASFTLTRMAEGGLFDQLAGGFYRYSVDAGWQIPHFEKMLADNAQLLALYAGAARLTGEPLFAATAQRTAAWLLAGLQDPGGALQASLDADSEGCEGRYYLWDAAQVRAALPEPQWQAFAPRYGLDRPPNFDGQWHLCVRADLEALAARLEQAPAHLESGLQAARATLLALRAQRIGPERDLNILCSWNALTVAGLVSAARCLGGEEWVAGAERIVDYLRRVHWRDGRLLACSVDGQARFGGDLDDHAFLLDALLALAGLRFEARELQWAVDLAETLLARFADPLDGGFYCTADDHEPLIARLKSSGDEAVPAGSALAAHALLRLGWLLAEPRYLAAAVGTVRAAWPQLLVAPEAHATLLLALEDWLDPPPIIVLRGQPPLLQQWQAALAQLPAPRQWVLAIPEAASALPAALAARVPRGAACAYVCRGLVCSAVVDRLDALLEFLARPPPSQADAAVSTGLAGSSSTR